MNEIKFKIKIEQDPETFRRTKSLIINDYQDMNVYDRIDFLNLLIEWSSKELDLMKEVSKRKISTKRRLDPI